MVANINFQNQLVLEMTNSAQLGEKIGIEVIDSKDTSVT